MLMNATMVHINATVMLIVTTHLVTIYVLVNMVIKEMDSIAQVNKN